MKRFCIIILAFTIVFGFSAVSLAEDLDSDTATVEAKIKTLAELEIVANELFTEVLEGKEGLYISDAHQVKNKAQDLWDLTDDDIVNHESVDGVLFDIRSNDDVNVKVESPFDGDWLNSPSAFLVFEHWSPWNHLGNLHNNHPSEEDNGAIEFTHGGGGWNQYKIGGSIYI
jgi:hypothetical protein